MLILYLVLLCFCFVLFLFYWSLVSVYTLAWGLWDGLLYQSSLGKMFLNACRGMRAHLCASALVPIAEKACPGCSAVPRATGSLRRVSRLSALWISVTTGLGMINASLSLFCPVQMHTPQRITSIDSIRKGKPQSQRFLRMMWALIFLSGPLALILEMAWKWGQVIKSPLMQSFFLNGWVNKFPNQWCISFPFNLRQNSICSLNPCS